MIPKTGMVLAAGLGLRMRPLTDTMPKPLVRVVGRALIDHTLDRLEAARVENVVVNAHYRADMLIRHLAQRRSPRIAIQEEAELLETGGGVTRALPLLGERFFVLNSDIVWLDGKVGTLERLARAFDDESMDAILLLQRTTTAVGYDGTGDYFFDAEGRARRRREREIAPYIFGGVQILSRRLFDGARIERFSLNRLFDRAEAAGRLGAIVHDGEWYHIGTPAGLAEAEERLTEYHFGR